MKGLDGRMFVVLALGIGLGWGTCWLHLQPQIHRLQGRVAALRRRLKRIAEGQTRELARGARILPFPSRARGA